MRIKDALSRIAAIKPSRYGDELMVEWLSRIDETIRVEIMQEGEGPLRYDAATDMDKELLAPYPYDEIYITWLQAQIDLNNAEMGRFNNDMLLYNTQYTSLCDWWIREHMPKQKNYVRV